MMLAKSLRRWVANGLISAEQSQKITAFEKSRNGGLFVRFSLILAGLLIGLGICLVVGANWEAMPVMLRLLGVYVVFGGFIYGLCRTYQNDNAKLREFFFVTCFLMIGATIGLVGQTFNLSGGWQSFALAWAILGIPYVFFSRSRVLNGAWLALLLSSFEWGHFLEKLIVWYPWILAIKWENYIVLLLITVVLFCCAVSFGAKKVDDKVHQFSVLPEAVSLMALFAAYYILFAFSFVSEDIFAFKTDKWLIRGFVFAFLIGRMVLAVKEQNVISFRRNAILLELYIFALFIVQFGDLLTSGIGFIICGLLILGLVKVLKYTSRYIKNMEIFNV